MKKYAIYIRVSTREQGQGDGKSPENQEHRCRAFISSQHDDPRYEKEAMVFRDIGQSGKDLDRPGFEEMMNAVQRGEVDTIIFTELSRISRSVMDFLELAEKLNRQGVHFVSIKEQYNTKTALGKMLITIIMALNQFERETIAERTKAGLFARAERGLWAGPIPLGYQRSGQSGHLDIDEEESIIVSQIYELYEQLGSIRGVEDHLEENGVMKPAVYKNDGSIKDPPSRFSDATLRRILENPVYLGKREINKKNKNKDQSTLDVQDQYKIVDGAWDPIISEELASRVHRRLQFNRNNYGAQARTTNHDFLLRGYLICEECGDVLDIERAKCNQYLYYKHSYSGSTCKVKRWKAQDVETTVFSHLLDLCYHSGILDEAIQYTQERRMRDAQGVPDRIRIEEQKLKEVRNQISAMMMTLKVTPHTEVPLSIYDEMSRLEKELRYIESELVRLRRIRDRVKPSVKEVRTISQRLKSLPKILQETDTYHIHQFLIACVYRIELRGQSLGKVFLLNTPKLLNSFNTYTENVNKGWRSSLQPSCTSPCRT